MAILKVSTKPPTSAKGLKALLAYVLKEEKTEEKLIDGIGDFRDFEYGYDYDQDRVCQEFRRVQKEFGKTDGRLCAHFIMSFPPGEVSAEQAHSIGIELAERLWPDQQVLVVTHVDKEHLHNHFVINSVSYTDGHKLHNKKSELEDMKRICNHVCQSHHLSVPKKGKHVDGSNMASDELTTGSKNFWNLVKAGKESYIVGCATCIQEILPTVASKEDFCTQMQQHGWTVCWTDDRKHITFVDADGHRVRDSKISKSFNLSINKADLLETFRQNEKTLTEKKELENTRRYHKRSHRRM